jgi:hypothetical protein
VRLFWSRGGLPLAVMVPIGLLGCEADRGYRPYEDKSRPYSYYDNFFNGSMMDHDGRGGGSWDSHSVEDHVQEKYRR